MLKPLELVCFGSPTARLVGAGSPPELRWRKHVALLVYLALSPSRSRSRDHLLGLLWAEQPERGARKALNMAVSRLREALGDERLRSESDTLALSADGLEVDALQFLTQAETAPEAALPLLRGEFLEGFHLKDAPEFEDWMARERERYRALAASTLIAAGERRLASGLPGAADIARRALALQPRSEPAVRLLMRATALSGDSAAALAAYHEFVERLEREVGEQPGRALAALAERIRTESWRPAGSDTTRTAPLVGREQTHCNAFELIAQGITKGGGARTLVIVSPPGLGRSRLLAECARRLALDGAQVLQVRPVSNDHDARWSTLRLLIRAGLGAARGLAAARPDALGALAGLAPELGDRFASRDVHDVADMANALASVISAVAEERPLVIAVDDAQWADGVSLAALGAALRLVKDSSVVLLLTVAQGVGDAPRELLQLESDVGRALSGAVLRLGLLDENDLATLVAALAPWCHNHAERDRLTRRLAYETAGNPFFAVTLLNALANASNLQKDMVAWPPRGGTIDAPLPFSVPSLVRHATVVRLGELKPPEVAVLSAASICGQALELDLIAQIAELSSDEVEAALQGCERRQLVLFDGRRYTFAAPLIAEVVRAECLTRGQRRKLERRAIDALAGRTDLQSRVLRIDLLSRVAPDQSALDLALAVARDASEMGARRMVEWSLAAAERISQDAQLDPKDVKRLRTHLL